ncbi:MAG: hypothetical protein ABIP94_19710, partial [Planctomycetota bacterium]
VLYFVDEVDLTAALIKRLQVPIERDAAKDSGKPSVPAVGPPTVPPGAGKEDAAPKAKGAQSGHGGE